jgi:hypothetical protein
MKVGEVGTGARIKSSFIQREERLYIDIEAICGEQMPCTRVKIAI